MKDCIKKTKKLNSARRSNYMKGEALLKKQKTKKLAKTSRSIAFFWAI